MLVTETNDTKRIPLATRMHAQGADLVTLAARVTKLGLAIEHLRPLRRRKRLSDMQTVGSASVPALYEKAQVVWCQRSARPNSIGRLQAVRRAGAHSSCAVIALKNFAVPETCQHRTPARAAQHIYWRPAGSPSDCYLHSCSHIIDLSDCALPPHLALSSNTYDTPDAVQLQV